ncbi:MULTISPECIES: hypothetical protein [unclassified Methylobacterium]|jgi:hypothetical protein|uniref:hypothetical protein n=1 Tax=unclassified Methylobacterium TaxID=2615210 RepID=UPI0005BC951D|nr:MULTISPECIES: hypothetical protein [unclassified Methylobacterium]SFU94263.1 hypothetical protein SAMN02799643_03316 [Methylobacterium sp. UNCCL125]
MLTESTTVRREQLATLCLNVARVAMAGGLHGVDALAVVDAVRAIRDALPADAAPAEQEASDAA